MKRKEHLEEKKWGERRRNRENNDDDSGWGCIYIIYTKGYAEVNKESGN